MVQSGKGQPVDAEKIELKQTIAHYACRWFALAMLITVWGNRNDSMYRVLSGFSEKPEIFDMLLLYILVLPVEFGITAIPALIIWIFAPRIARSLVS
jgi:NhaP-type Na+/H+ and K+/H+ antiporter